MTSAGPLVVTVLDDYQDVARTALDLGAVTGPVEIRSVGHHVEDVDELVVLLSGSHVLVAMRERTAIDAQLLERLPDLRLIVTTGPANAVIDVAAARSRGVEVCGTGGYLTPTSEHTWALILSLLRHVPAEDHAIRTGGWQTRVGSELAGRTLGIVGLGRLGRLVARVGAAFDMRVIAWSQNLTAEGAARHGVERVERGTLFSTADVVTLHLVLSERTRGLVGAEDLRQMKRSAVIINTSRGPIIDEASLVRALAEGWIAGAGLDVYDVEPLPIEHPFRTMANTVLTPHIGYVTDGLYDQFFREISEDIAAFVHGEPIRLVPEP